MAYILQKLLGIKDDETLFGDGIKKLEKSVGMSGVDTRLIADIITKSNDVTRKLGLKTNDTTGKELYYSLIAAVWSSDAETILKDTDYVLKIIDNKIISFNLIDVIENAHHELPYGKQHVYHGRMSLRGEIVNRYCSHTRTDNKTTCQVASEMGILTASDAWYTISKHNHNKLEKKS